ncbi:zinc finger protein 519-like [Oryzias melastigma]|uniref:zinc finger protein 519-like n=1 Tax=Oryzias melastigma TaxID=30732 RepID=UPI00168D05B1|nr:zinc finger protein 519-like [Oryzias melastigma]
MSAVQSLREFIGERLTAAAEEIFIHVEKTIFKLEEELLRQRRLMDVMMKPQVQAETIVLPQCYLRNQERNSNLKQEEAEPPQMKEQKEEVWISQNEDQLRLKQEDDILMVTLCEENELREEDLNSQQLQTQSFNDGQDEDQREASTTDGETELQGSRNVKCYVQNEESSHRTQTKKRYFCKECEKSYTTARSLNHHMKIHTGKKSHPCTECDKSFSQSSDLTRHMRTHTGAKPFTCSVCGKGFSQGVNLTNHVRIHAGERPFSCKECSRSFNHSSHLTRHMIIHTGEKPFSCQLCGKRFSQRYALKRHIKTNEEKMFSCKISELQVKRAPK